MWLKSLLFVIQYHLIKLSNRSEFWEHCVSLSYHHYTEVVCVMCCVCRAVCSVVLYSRAVCGVLHCRLHYTTQCSVHRTETRQILSVRLVRCGPRPGRAHQNWQNSEFWVRPASPDCVLTEHTTGSWTVRTPVGLGRRNTRMSAPFCLLSVVNTLGTQQTWNICRQI